MKEVWKDISGYKGRYQISNFGNVKSIPRKHQAKIILLSAATCMFGYKYVSLMNNKKTKSVKVHRLVLQEFVGFSELECNHMDGDKTNNNLSNLEYCTRSQNIKHAYDNGLKSAKGEKNKASILTEKYVKEIKALIQEGWPQLILADAFGVNRRTVSAINCGVTWRLI